MITEDQLLNKLSYLNCLSSDVEKAISQAKSSHGKLLRDSGHPVLEDHLYPICFSILNHFPKRKDLSLLVSLGLLHDAMEDDCSFTPGKCIGLFGEEFTNYLKILTKSRDFYIETLEYKKDEVLNQTFKYINNGKYLDNIFLAPEVCKIVKLEDRLNNLGDIVKIGSNLKKLRYLIESETTFLPLAKTVLDYDYTKMFNSEIKRLCAYS